MIVTGINHELKDTVMVMEPGHTLEVPVPLPYASEQKMIGQYSNIHVHV
jgi:hypothetical protein